MTTILFTADELELLRHALRSFEKDFGHDEADVVREVKRLLLKVEQAATAVPSDVPD
jgi:hypothetical protein